MTDSILRSYQAYSFTSIVPFPAAAAAEGALGLLTGETEGFAIDATTYDTAAIYGGGTVAVIDTGTPANDLDNVALNDSSSNLVQSGTSAKIGQFPTAPFARWSPHNRIRGTTHIFESNWSLIGVTPDDNATTAPDGTSTGCLITVNGANNRLNGFTLGNFSVADGDVLTCSVYAKVGSGTNYMLMRWAQDANNVGQWFNIGTGALGTAEADGGFFVGSNRTIVDAGGGWWRCSFTVTASGGGASGPNLQIWAPDADNSTTTTSGRTQYVWGPQIVRGYSAGPFLAHGAVNADAIGIAQSYEATTSRYGMLIEPSAQNLVLYSNDFTNAAWTKSNMSTAKTATGPDDGTNSATTLTASAGNATALQAITSASSARITGFWVKRRTGSGNIQLTQDNGSIWTTVTVTSDWTRVQIASVTSTNPTVGIRIVTNADAVDVWGFQHETGGVLTSTIPTLSASVTRAVDSIVINPLTTFPFSQTAGTIYTDCTYSGPVAVAKYMYDLTTSTWVNRHRLSLYSNDDTLIDNFDGTNTGVGNLTCTDSNGDGPNARYQCSAAWAQNDFDGTTQGGALQTDASGDIPSDRAFWYIGRTGFGSGENSNPVTIFRLVYVPRQVQTEDANLQTWRYNF